MYQSNSLLPETMRTIDSSTFTGSYQAVGTAFSNPVRILKMVNNASVPITISWNGTDDHDFIANGGFALYDAGCNKGTPASSLDIPKGTQIYVKGSAGIGAVYLIVLVAVTPSMTIPL